MACPKSLAWLILLAPVARSGEPCARVLSINGAIKTAAALDGTLVCIHGTIPAGAVQTEIVSTEKPRWVPWRGGIRRIGLIDGENSPLHGHLYRPKTFDPLDSIGNREVGGTNSLEVVLFGVLLYNRNVVKALSEKAPPGDDRYDPIRGLSYPVEFIALQLVSAKQARRR